MRKFLLTLLISIFSITVFSAHAANKGRSDLKKHQTTQAQKQANDSVGDKPLSMQNYQVQSNETIPVSPTDLSPPKPTDVDYTPPPSLNDRNPISN